MGNLVTDQIVRYSPCITNRITTELDVTVALRSGVLKQTIISPCAQRDDKKQRITKVAHSASVIPVYKKNIQVMSVIFSPPTHQAPSDKQSRRT